MQHSPRHLSKPRAAVERAGHAALVRREAVRRAVEREGRVGDPVGHAADHGAKIRRVVEIARLVVEAEDHIREIAVAIRHQKLLDYCAVLQHMYLGTGGVAQQNYVRIRATAQQHVRGERGGGQRSAAALRGAARASRRSHHPRRRRRAAAACCGSQLDLHTSRRARARDTEIVAYHGARAAPRPTIDRATHRTCPTCPTWSWSPPTTCRATCSPPWRTEQPLAAHREPRARCRRRPTTARARRAGSGCSGRSQAMRARSPCTGRGTCGFNTFLNGGRHASLRRHGYLTAFSASTTLASLPAKGVRVARLSVGMAGADHEQLSEAVRTYGGFADARRVGRQSADGEGPHNPE